MKAIFKYLVAIIFIVLTGSVVSACCAEKQFTAKINFINAPEELGFESYEKVLEFKEDMSVSFVVPEGYDHEGIIATIGDTGMSYTVDFSEMVEEKHWYTVSKTITFNINKVIRDFELNIDLSTVRLRKFEIKLDNNILSRTNSLSNFTAIAIKESKGDLVDILETDILKTYELVGNKFTVDYGDRVVLVYNQDSSSYDLNTIYSQTNYELDNSLKEGVNGVEEYTYIDVAKKGNSYYYIQNRVNTRLFYIGKLQESFDFFYNKPGTKNEPGFKFDKDPNTFYLLTNLSKYSSDLMNIKVYTSIDEPYLSSVQSQDQVGATTIKQITHSSELYNRYDVHKMYVGNETAQSDNLVETENKTNTYRDLYITFESSIGIDYFQMYLLRYEKEIISEGGKYITPKLELDKNIISARGKYYAKISKETIDSFLNDTVTIYENSPVNCKTGSAILYVTVNNPYSHIHTFKEEFGLITFGFNYEFIKDKSVPVNVFDYSIVPYILDEETGEKKYGYVDYHRNLGDSWGRDEVWFYEEDLYYHVPAERMWRYKNNLYVDVCGADYTGFRTIKIGKIDFVCDTDSMEPNGAVAVVNPKEYNGLREHRLNMPNEPSFMPYYQYINVKIYLQNSVDNCYLIDFSDLDIEDLSDSSIYVTNNPGFLSISDFSIVNYLTKQGEVANIYDKSPIKLGDGFELYYLVVAPSDPDFNFEITLYRNDETGIMTRTEKLCDITGKERVVEHNGKRYQVYVKVSETVYDSIDAGAKVYAVNNL